MTHLITALFESRQDANEALARLVKAGIPQSRIQIRDGTSATSGATSGGAIVGQGGVSTHYDTNRDEKGFWASLSDLFMPDEDRSTYSEALHRGNVILSVNVEESQSSIAEDILDDEGTINVNEREQSWRSEGWTPRAGAGIAPGAASGSGLGTASSAASTTARSTGVGGKESIPIIEERLSVGKRIENSGRVRVRSYVVDTPVSEQVSLRQEHVSVERRPVDRPLGAGDAAFQNRTIEATESRERAVVNKEARVTEEVVLNKNVENRTETVTDKVRKTQVDVEDDRISSRTGTDHSGATGAGTRKPV